MDSKDIINYRRPSPHTVENHQVAGLDQPPNGTGTDYDRQLELQKDSSLWTCPPFRSGKHHTMDTTCSNFSSLVDVIELCIPKQPDTRTVSTHRLSLWWIVNASHIMSVRNDPCAITLWHKHYSNTNPCTLSILYILSYCHIHLPHVYKAACSVIIFIAAPFAPCTIALLSYCLQCCVYKLVIIFITT